MAAQLNTPHERVSFGEFEFDCGTRELKKDGTTLRLEPQPAKVLSVLIRHAGEIVSRQELIREVWGSDTFVDFDQGLNYAVRRIRAALGDGVETPRYLETLPKTGYRFIAHITALKSSDPTDDQSLSSPPPRFRPKLNRVSISVIALISLLILAAISVAWKYRRREPASRFGETPTSLAVLPLRNLSADPAQEYFSDGMTDELITDLAKTTGIRVISHTSVERYKKTTLSLPQIARELGVDAVVEGTVTRAGNRVRITTQLIDARNDKHLWADSYERDLTDTLAIQNVVARDIAIQIQGNVLASREIHESNSRNVPPGAMDSYMRGRYLWSQRDSHSIAAARASLEDAVRQAPDFAAAYSGLADAYAVAWNDPDLPLAEKYAKKALSLDPELAEAHASLGMILFIERRAREAQPELLRAIDLNPNYAMAHHYYSAHLFDQGRLEDALLENDRARQLDPFGVAVNSFRTVILIDSHRLSDALVQATNLAELLPQIPGGYGYMARIYWLQGRVPEALEAEKKEGLARHEDGWVRCQAELEELYRRAGARPAIFRSAELMVKYRQSKPFAAALQYGNLRDSQKVLEVLRANLKNGDVVTEIRFAPELDFIRHDPRFIEIEHRVHPDL